ncbi:unnamed protein product [Symbiodinium natans]|uniref:Uncharacterized protein n=1 Tax=Symbiodinium natans TaxID=878477 RepID=A0A812KYB7_9DINO|nr:unnamed protein product [Symbiodinium natans]
MLGLVEDSLTKPSAAAVGVPVGLRILLHRPSLREHTMEDLKILWRTDNNPIGTFVEAEKQLDLCRLRDRQLRSEAAAAQASPSQMRDKEQRALRFAAYYCSATQSTGAQYVM